MIKYFLLFTVLFFSSIQGRLHFQNSSDIKKTVIVIVIVIVIVTVIVKEIVIVIEIVVPQVPPAAC